MSEPAKTIDEFLAVVRKSGLVDEARLEEACAAWPDRSQPLPDELVEKLIAAELLTQWQVDRLREGKHRGYLLGKYKLLRLLGAGGMSSVYLAEHVNLHGKVAIKVLPVKNVGKTSYLARFEQEAREAFRLSHHNIVRAIDLDTSGSIHYFVMDYVEGTDLHAKVKAEGPLPIRDALDYVRQAALGLQHAHDEGVIHRDIKPANLILDKRGTVKILDFGLALAGKDDEDGSLTQEFGEKVLGTADYLPPEQARDSHLADNRSDIYALGCTLYYLLVGKVPFAGGKLADRIRAHETKPPPNPLDERPDVPPTIVELYFRMMEKNPEARPRSAKEVSDSLGAWLNSAAGSARIPTAPLRPPPRRTTTQGGASAASRGPGTGTAVLAPGGSGVGRRPPGSGVGPGPFAFGPPSGSGVGRASVKPPITSGTKPPAKPRPADDDTASHKPRRFRLPQTIAGLPLWLWLAAVAGILLAIGLGVAFWLQQQAKQARRELKSNKNAVSTIESGVGGGGASEEPTPEAESTSAPESSQKPEPESAPKPKLESKTKSKSQPPAAPKPKPPREPSPLDDIEKPSSTPE